MGYKEKRKRLKLRKRDKVARSESSTEPVLTRSQRCNNRKESKAADRLEHERKRNGKA